MSLPCRCCSQSRTPLLPAERSPSSHAAFKYSIYGQTWAANNCLHRNREQMNEWVLFVDIDELVTLPGLPGGLRQLAARLEEEGYESTSFHSVGYMPSYCTAEGEEGEAAPGTGGGGGGGVGLADRMVLRAPFPERCESIWQRNCSLTSRIATFGRRKVSGVATCARCTIATPCCVQAVASAALPPPTLRPPHTPPVRGNALV